MHKHHRLYIHICTNVCIYLILNVETIFHKNSQFPLDLKLTQLL